jgi:hypothetical protein
LRLSHQPKSANPGVGQVAHVLRVKGGRSSVANNFPFILCLKFPTIALVLLEPLKLSIRRTSILGRVTTLGTLFDSNAYTPDTDFQTQELVMPAVTFDFTQNMYWLEVTLTKADALNQPGFGSAQITQ